MLEERRGAVCLTYIDPYYSYRTRSARDRANPARESLSVSECKEKVISREGSARRETMRRAEGVRAEEAESSERRSETNFSMSSSMI